MIRSATFNGTKYAIMLNEYYGLCVFNNNEPFIHIPHGLDDTKKSLDTFIHEMLHACFPQDSINKKQITTAARDIARVVRRTHTGEQPFAWQKWFEENMQPGDKPDENFVTETAHKLAAELWKQGWRLK